MRFGSISGSEVILQKEAVNDQGASAGPATSPRPEERGRKSEAGVLPATAAGYAVYF